MYEGPVASRNNECNKALWFCDMLWLLFGDKKTKKKSLKPNETYVLIGAASAEQHFRSNMLIIQPCNISSPPDGAIINKEVRTICTLTLVMKASFMITQLARNLSVHEFHETCHSVTFIVLVNSHQRWKQMRNRVCFHLWCEFTLALWMDGWMREFNATFAYVRPNRQAGTTVMRWMALVARMKRPSNMAAPGVEPGSRG